MQKWWKDPIKRAIIGKKISDSKKGIKSPRISFRPKKDKPEKPPRTRTLADLILFSPEYADWRENILKRDNYTCKECGFKGKPFSETAERPYPLRVHRQGGMTISSMINMYFIETMADALRCEALWSADGETYCFDCWKKLIKNNE